MIIKYSTGKIGSVYSNDEAEAKKEVKKEANIKEAEAPKKEESEKKEKPQDAKE
jgi:hypothetical protein